MTKLTGAGHDERGKYHGGQAGDQSGTEFYTKNFYRRPWTEVWIPKTKATGDAIADFMVRAANNNKIGYDMYQRNDLWNQLARGKTLSTITSCEVDCSSSTSCACYFGAGLKAFKTYKDNNHNCPTTSTIGSVLKSTNQFVKHTGSKWCNTGDYLPRGTIVNCPGHHVEVVTTGGPKGVYPNGSGKASKVSKVVTAVKTKVTKYSGSLSIKLPSRGYFIEGDGYKTNKGMTEDIIKVQKFLKWVTGIKLNLDGDYGPNTVRACKKFQEKSNIAIDGKFGKTTLNKVKSYSK